MDTQWRYWKIFEALLFTLGSAFGLAGAFYKPTAFSDGYGWVVLVLGIVFAVLAVSSWRGLWNNWTEVEEGRAIFRMFAWIVLAPVVIGLLAVAAIASVAIYNAGGLFTPAPWWAVVIISLLVMIYFKKG